MDEPQKSAYCQKVIKVNYFSYYGNAFLRVILIVGIGLPSVEVNL